MDRFRLLWSDVSNILIRQLIDLGYHHGFWLKHGIRRWTDGKSLRWGLSQVAFYHRQINDHMRQIANDLCTSFLSKKMKKKCPENTVLVCGSTVKYSSILCLTESNHSCVWFQDQENFGISLLINPSSEKNNHFKGMFTFFATRFFTAEFTDMIRWQSKLEIILETNSFTKGFGPNTNPCYRPIFSYLIFM